MFTRQQAKANAMSKNQTLNLAKVQSSLWIPFFFGGGGGGRGSVWEVLGSLIHRLVWSMIPRESERACVCERERESERVRE